MTRRYPPLWLSTPSRFSGMPRQQARIALVLLALLLALSLTALAGAAPPPASHDPARRADDEADIMLYEQIADGVRHGGNYYEVAAEALRAGDYPLRPFITFRLPTLALVEGALPRWALAPLLYLLVAGVVAAWWVRLRPVFARPPPFAVALLLLAGGLVMFVQRDLLYFHEVWAGLLIALSLGLRRDDRWVEAVAIGLMAMLVRETALLFAVAMLAFAWIGGARREALGWGVAILVFAGVLALHAHAVAGVVRPLDPHSPGWSGMLGFGFFIRATVASTALALPPLWLAAPLAGLSLFGWTAWCSGVALRALALFALFGVLIGVFGRADTFYWALMIAPIFLVGLAFVPDALRDLTAAAFDRRRITVTRIGR